mmetsp:Transcript_49934/g.122613  ORF Transcript_49934/g.122613 Transcript_49934/m.122613 type:complete len:404 (-) Transcript_49934:664-1875(-)|eukprot:CAMPEP_0198313352 /NCGR_PEP_ID=MMETSP1450-20131203/4390_1 /TAXON_ID=753684 ORGANISM="Madagascaria erythrocladiodes, Strain CCMP3234" /NCGR_SAMPLE_ID=MMETSP1450 /ASSEMBLY_ACC=CAM_ASM_001115 /LENGTH=403 /DNA_ID=CAMNT_0044016339 /DNA_START=101 /DNA_END=1312 /DNA_ORIENTATION=-
MKSFLKQADAALQKAAAKANTAGQQYGGSHHQPHSAYPPAQSHSAYPPSQSTNPYPPTNDPYSNAPPPPPPTNPYPHQPPADPYPPNPSNPYPPPPAAADVYPPSQPSNPYAQGPPAPAGGAPPAPSASDFTSPFGAGTVAAVPTTDANGAGHGMQGEARYGIQQFINVTAQVDKQSGVFELERDKMLEINLNPQTRASMASIKLGTMVAYRGDIKFSRASTMKQGVMKMVKKAMTGEGVTMAECRGVGKIFVADEAKKVVVLNLTPQDSICCNGNDILAMTETVKWDIKVIKGGAGMIAGGLTNVYCTGPGMVAITCHGDAVTLAVGPNNPVFTDPNATVAWSGNLVPQLKTDVNMKTLLGRSSGETVQLAFHSTTPGWVTIQPYEEADFQDPGVNQNAGFY